MSEWAGLACCLGRLPHARTAISGGIKSNGLMLRSRPVSTVEVVEDLVRQGIERLVVCDRYDTAQHRR